MRSSRNDWWFAATTAPPVLGTFSRPTTFGRYSSRRIGPRKTYFIRNQNMVAPPGLDPPPKPVRYPRID